MQFNLLNEKNEVKVLPNKLIKDRIIRLLERNLDRSQLTGLTKRSHFFLLQSAKLMLISSRQDVKGLFRSIIIMITRVARTTRKRLHAHTVSKTRCNQIIMARNDQYLTFKTNRVRYLFSL